MPRQLPPVPGGYAFRLRSANHTPRIRTEGTFPSQRVATRWARDTYGAELPRRAALELWAYLAGQWRMVGRRTRGTPWVALDPYKQQPNTFDADAT